MTHLTGLLGLAVILALAWLFSTDRRAIRWSTVAWGLALQFVFAVVVLRTGIGNALLGAAGRFVTHVLSFAYAGSTFVFGTIGASHSQLGTSLAFQVLPIIIFVSAIFAALYHLGIMQRLIQLFALLMRSTLRISGAESVNLSASIFMGQSEAPLSIRPFLAEATRSELMTVMTTGMAHVSGAIMGAYIVYGIEAQHLLAAVIMTAPGTVVVAKMLVPETQLPLTAGSGRLPPDETHRGENLIGAIARGSLDGGRLAFYVAVMLVSFIALVALVNGGFSAAHGWLGAHGVPFPSSLNALLGPLFAPAAWLIGIPWHDALRVGNVLGTRMVLNELLAYSMLGAQKAQLAPRSFTIATFALCGFANIGSIGVQIGGIGALAPTRRNELARLGFRAMLAGTAANLMSAAIVGVLLP